MGGMAAAGSCFSCPGTMGAMPCPKGPAGLAAGLCPWPMSHRGPGRDGMKGMPWHHTACFSLELAT